LLTIPWNVYNPVGDSNKIISQKRIVVGMAKRPHQHQGYRAKIQQTAPKANTVASNEWRKSLFAKLGVFQSSPSNPRTGRRQIQRNKF
jgi:hypothetical protein